MKAGTQGDEWPLARDILVEGVVLVDILLSNDDRVAVDVVARSARDVKREEERVDNRPDNLNVDALEVKGETARSSAKVIAGYWNVVVVAAGRGVNRKAFRRIEEEDDE